MDINKNYGDKELEKLIGEKWEKINKELDGVNPYAYRLGFRDCFAALQPSTLPLIETDENKGEFKSPHQIVYENFKELGDAIEDDDLTLWYKDLIETCIEEYHKQFAAVPLIDKGEDAVEFAEWLREEGYRPVDFSDKPNWQQFGSKMGWLQGGMSIIISSTQAYKYFKNKKNNDTCTERKICYINNNGCS